jgi:hypothetical protein
MRTLNFSAFLTSEPWVQFQVTSCEINSGQGGTGEYFYPKFLQFFSGNHHSTISQYRCHNALRSVMALIMQHLITSSLFEGGDFISDQTFCCLQFA